MLLELFSRVGIATTIFVLFKFLRFIHLYTRPSSLKRYHHGSNPWALVTGASDGIGLGFARELASHGFNVILHGRNPTKLDKVKSQLTHEYPNVTFRILIVDAAAQSSSRQIVDFIANLADLHLTVLVNNVGGVEAVMDVAIKPLQDNSIVDADNLINLNARFPTHLTRALLSLLQKSSPALVMNIGSMSSFGVPYASIYSGSKAYNMSFSNALAAELPAEGHQIEFLGIVVGMVTDVSHRKSAVSLMTPGARTMAKAALDRVGCGKGVVIGYWGHAVQHWLMELLPRGLRTRISLAVMKDLREKEQAKLLKRV